MSLNLQWTVLKQPHLPAKWKPMLTVLALMAKDDGTKIFASEETLAGYLGVHRVTAHHVLRELHKAGLVVVTRRGGRWRTRKGVVGRTSERRIDVDRVRTFDSRSFRCSDATTSCADHVATWLQAAPDLTATSLHDDADDVVTPLHLKTGTYLKTGSTRAKTGTSPKGTDRMAVAVASDDDTAHAHTRLDNLRAKKQQQKTGGLQ
jgi:hypothetical protein